MPALAPKAVGNEIFGDLVDGEWLKPFRQEPFDLGFAFSVGDSDLM